MHRINSEKDWQLEGIYTDKGISGTSVKNVMSLTE